MLQTGVCYSKRHLKTSPEARSTINVALLLAVFEDAQRSLEGCSYSTELSGSTCVLAHLHRRQLAVGWVGDSRAVMGRARGGGRHLAVPLTQDHKPAEPLESARILAAGGRVERCFTHLAQKNTHMQSPAAFSVEC